MNEPRVVVTSSLLGRAFRTRASVLAGVAMVLTCLFTPPACRADESAEPAEAAGFQLPEGEPFGPQLVQQATAALKAKGPDYVPRTRHKREDGSAIYTNRLILESSPYLLQHAHNPVNWYPWGDEAFETARRLKRPVLLSIGYSTCHWCHVMEEESFEDEEIAGYLNANYIAIKVDREERPDIDAIYMSAVQMLAGRGGWPMTTWLTPDREPYYGGTYFPARDGDRGSRKGFLTILGELSRVYVDQPEQVAAKAKSISERIRTNLRRAVSEVVPGLEVLQKAAESYERRFDKVHGGIQRAPKFPSAFPVRLLLRYYARTGEQNWLDMATLTLKKMAAGGMYDQVGGGFHRYSVDGRWLVPHFEKMLYDNALLTMAYLEGFQATGDPELSRVAREILTYVSREMTAPDGGFYSATDADSLGPHGEREEGWFFTWAPAEIRAVLEPEKARLVETFYAVTGRGNFEGRNILHAPRTLEAVAGQLKMQPRALRSGLDASRDALYRVRLARPAPLRDDKILTSWNGLMVSAFAQGGFILDDPELIRRAERAADFVLGQLRREGRLLRSYKDGAARHNAYLDDYAFLIAGLLDLYEATSKLRWLEESVQLQEVLDRHYRDDQNGGYFMTSDDHESLLAREKPAYDGAEPAGNSIALMNLLRLHELTTDDRYRSGADGLLRAFGGLMVRSPTALSEMLMALDFHLDSAKEVILVTAGPREEAEPFLAVLRKTYLPNKVVAVVSEGADLDAQAKRVPLVKGKVARKGKTTAYVCEQGICQLPTTDLEIFARQLKARPKAAAS